MFGHCIHCGIALTAPGTPVRFWSVRRWFYGCYCPSCLNASWGSFLVGIRRAQLMEMDAPTRRAWLDSLMPRDRAAAKDFFACYISSQEQLMEGPSP